VRGESYRKADGEPVLIGRSTGPRVVVATVSPQKMTLRGWRHTAGGSQANRETQHLRPAAQDGGGAGATRDGQN